METSHRQQLIATRVAVCDRAGLPRDAFALSWLNESEVTARLRVGRGFVYRPFEVDDALPERLLDWIHSQPASQ